MNDKKETNHNFCFYAGFSRNTAKYTQVEKIRENVWGGGASDAALFRETKEEEKWLTNMTSLFM